jgi:transcriptional regulator with XRE-family HTH domain
MATTVPDPANPYQHHLRAWREHRGLRQLDLARMLDTTKSVVSRWETGERSLSMDMFFRLCAALEITPPEFFRDPNAPEAVDDLLASSLKYPRIREYMLDRLREAKAQFDQLNLSPSISEKPPGARSPH